MDIKKIIENVTSCLPMTWPLQSFIAMNPLWDRVNSQPIYSVLKELSKVASIKGTLSIKQYHLLYRNNEINPLQLRTVVIEWLQKNVIADSNAISCEHFDMTNLLYKFLLTNGVQEQLERLDQSKWGKKNNEFQTTGSSLGSDKIKFIQESLIKWCAAFFDFGQAIWPMPSTANDLFTAWRELAIYESSRWKKLIENLPPEPLKAIEFLIQKLNIPEILLEPYFLEVLFQLPGWVSFIKWLEAKPKNNFTHKTASIAGFIAIWLAYEVYFREADSSLGNKKAPTVPSRHELPPPDVELRKVWNHWLSQTVAVTNKPFPQSAVNFLLEKLDLFSIRWIWQTSWEKSYQHNLLTLLPKQPDNKKNPHSTKDFQAIFCIDTRSEGLRRHLEALNHWETFGFAGFFGFPFQLKDKEGGHQVAQSPPLIDPDIVLEFMQKKSTGAIYNQASDFFTIMGQVKNQGLAPYALFELIGSWLSLKLIGKTFFPSLYRKYMQKKKLTTSSILDSNFDNTIAGFSIEEATLSCEGFLKTIGLTKHFSKIVIICAHGATTDNNPYQSSFDCGACGGNAGAPNALIACAALNHPLVREKLAERQIHIPHDTHFVPACHNTTIDAVDILLHADSQEMLKLDLTQLTEDLQLACGRLREERSKSLPGNASVNNRQANWAELMPELGLVNNAAMIIAPRSLTQGLNLDRRVFLHSYEPSLDLDGKLLEGILTAPVVIAHWINAQYYFSTTDPELYGSGNKAIHNVVSKLAVMEGNRSDLKIGLPIQNVYFHGELLHQPLKLLVVIVAKRWLVNQLLDKHQEIKNLFDSQWAYLHIIEPDVENYVSQ